MSQNERQRQRPAFRGTGWDALEGRQLLSTTTLRTPFTGLRNRSAALVRWNTVAANHPNYGSRLGQIVQSLTPAPGQTTTPANTTGKTSGQISIPENNPMFTGLKFPSVYSPLTNTGAITGNNTGGGTRRATFKLNSLSTGLPGAQNRFGLSAGTGVVAGASTGRVMNPVTVNTPVTPVTTNTNTPSKPVTVAPTTSGVTTKATTLPASFAGGLNAVDPVSPAIAIHFRPFGLPDNVNFTADDVKAMKSAVDAFASAYTSGQDAAKDKAAVAALEAGLDDVAQNLWSASHVASKDDTAKFEQAATDFAKNYTNGADVAKDKAAWKALHSALDTFNASLKNPKAPADSATDPAVQWAPPGFSSRPQRGVDLIGLGGLVMEGQTVSADEVKALKSAVDTFASAYTGGANADTDEAALEAFQTAIGDLVSNHWVNAPGLDVSSDPGGAATFQEPLVALKRPFDPARSATLLPAKVGDTTPQSEPPVVVSQAIPVPTTATATADATSAANVTQPNV